MRAVPLTWHGLRWPREVTPEQLITICRLLQSVGGQPVVVQSIGSAGQVTHYLALPELRAATAVAQLQASLPGLALDPTARPVFDARAAAELQLSTRLRPLRTTDPTATSRTLLTALANTGRGEQLALQWRLGRVQPALAVPTNLRGWQAESWFGALLAAPFSSPRPLDPERRAALAAKQAEPGWRVIGQLAVSAATTGRAQQLLAQLVAALHLSDAPAAHFSAHRISPTRFSRMARSWRWPLRLNVHELAAVATFPVGLTAELPVIVSGSRVLAPTRAIPRRGRVLGAANLPGKERPLALTPSDGLRHLHVLGPTGSGKSTLLLHLIRQDMAAHRAVVVIEPKGDLIDAVLEQVPAARQADVVLLDPGDQARPVGLNPLALHGRSPELAADQLLGLFHALYLSSWGPRTHDILGASLLTLARTGGMSLTALPLLLTDAGFRRRIVPPVSDPIGLGPFWATFEHWSEAERAAAIGPVMNKLRPLLLRPELRAAIGQTEHSFDLRRVFRERKILLVNLSKRLLGPESAALLGSLVIAQLWQAVLARGAVAPERRAPAFVYVDEFQDYLHLPLDLADALAQARGLGVGFTLAHQYLHQLGVAMRAAVLANAQSKIAFRLSHDDARVLATESTLAPEDFQTLPAFTAYAQLVAQASIQPWCSLRTVPPGKAISDPAAVRAASAATYGIDRAEIEAELGRLFERHGGRDDDLSPRRMQPEAAG